ncbi:MAG TPA: hypothetical protein VFK05_30070 [Polyangiaceae bacterium]|nr:hypothetical protein [Polyangiaceae bacterium]
MRNADYRVLRLEAQLVVQSLSEAVALVRAAIPPPRHPLIRFYGVDGKDMETCLQKPNLLARSERASTTS